MDKPPKATSKQIMGLWRDPFVQACIGEFGARIVGAKFEDGAVFRDGADIVLPTAEERAEMERSQAAPPPPPPPPAPYRGAVKRRK